MHRKRRRERLRVWIELIIDKLDILSREYIPRALGLDLWSSRSSDEEVYSKLLGALKGLIEVLAGF